MGIAIRAATAVIASVPTIALAKPPALDVTSCGVACVKKATLRAPAPRRTTSYTMNAMTAMPNHAPIQEKVLMTRSVALRRAMERRRGGARRTSTTVLMPCLPSLAGRAGATPARRSGRGP